jgi:hypothetical protein
MTAVNKQAVAAAFGRAAGHYAQHDELQRLSASLLLASSISRPFLRCWTPAAAPAA